jgi:adenine-specific DNA-methyltransferase
MTAKSRQTAAPSAADIVDSLRIEVGRQIDARQKADLGQFFTVMPVARRLASMIKTDADPIHILDAGAGVGSLFTAAVAHLCARRQKPKVIQVTAYEIDAKLGDHLRRASRACGKMCEAGGVQFTFELVIGDFLQAAADMINDSPLFGGRFFDLAILNPPYYKINSRSETRRILRRIGIETSNIYTGFLAAAVHLLAPGGEIISITPRSFCNGTYFRNFRHWFLGEMTLRHLHSFVSRQDAFREDEVLQETVIFRAVKKAKRGRISVTSSIGPSDDAMTSQVVDYDQIVRPDDPQHFIRILTDDLAQQITKRMATCRTTLGELDLTVSTGRVVDFRARNYLRNKQEKGTVPLIWPAHFNCGYIAWPKEGVRKPEHFLSAPAVEDQLVPNEPYVLVRRFSAKEERRRVVASVYDPDRIRCRAVGFENHLNYFHQDGHGIEMRLARGLAAYLNSTIIDQYFRQFSGHTQVNATDLRNMRYPTREQLGRMGAAIGDNFPDQTAVDALVGTELFNADPLVLNLFARIAAGGTSAESLPA